jgi:hypothetical protein
MFFASALFGFIIKRCLLIKQPDYIAQNPRLILGLVYFGSETAQKLTSKIGFDLQGVFLAGADSHSVT